MRTGFDFEDNGIRFEGEERVPHAFATVHGQRPGWMQVNEAACVRRSIIEKRQEGNRPAEHHPHSRARPSKRNGKLSRVRCTALELERIALQDDYFVKRKLYPNVDFYSGLIYDAMGFPTDFFTVLFAIPRTAGWLAQWIELVDDDEQKIARPRQIYMGRGKREYVHMHER